MKRLILLLPFFLMGTACNNEAEDNNEPQKDLMLYNNAPEELISIDEMPAWLAAEVQKIESNLKPLAQYKIYQGVWKGSTVYHIWSYFSSAVLYDTYDEQGVRLDWEKNDVKDFRDNSRDWKLIYVIEWKPSQEEQ